MDLMIVLAGLLELGQVQVARSFRADLGRQGARAPAYAAAGVSIAFVVAVPFVYWRLGPGGLPLELLLCIPELVFYMSPRVLVFLSGGPQIRFVVAREQRRIKGIWNKKVASGTVTDDDVKWLKSASESLDRWRSPETSELIALYQEEVADILSDESADLLDSRERMRNTRVDELLRVSRPNR